ncbi:MAG TPA: antibiotic biosynthesis monooxygenase [Azospirillum sp.]|nr:antibiotic biosynthesis monooxygenase [Azospirillum sp.]
MIARLWRGSATTQNAEGYERHARDTVFPALASIPGHRGAILLRRGTGDGTEFLVLTLWDSMDAVRGFAGDAAQTAVVEPEARAVLADFDDVVRHFEVASWTVSS